MFSENDFIRRSIAPTILCRRMTNHIFWAIPTLVAGVIFFVNSVILSLAAARRFQTFRL